MAAHSRAWGGDACRGPSSRRCHHKGACEREEGGETLYDYVRSTDCGWKLPCVDEGCEECRQGWLYFQWIRRRREDSCQGQHKGGIRSVLIRTWRYRHGSDASDGCTPNLDGHVCRREHDGCTKRSVLIVEVLVG